MDRYVSAVTNGGLPFKEIGRDLDGRCPLCLNSSGRPAIVANFKAPVTKPFEFLARGLDGGWVSPGGRRHSFAHEPNNGSDCTAEDWILEAGEGKPP